MYDVKLIKQPSGRTHQVGGVYQPILDETTGEPEEEYVLCAIVDGHAVPLESYTTGYVSHQVGRADTAIDSSSTPAAGEATAGEGAAAAPPAEQPAG